MPVQAITHPSCAACRAPLVTRKNLLDPQGRSLGLVCTTCEQAGVGYEEVLFHAFGGMHGHEGRAVEPKPPYHVPNVESIEQLKQVALESVQRHPSLARYLCDQDRELLLAGQEAA